MSIVFYEVILEVLVVWYDYVIVMIDDGVMFDVDWVSVFIVIVDIGGCIMDYVVV